LFWWEAKSLTPQVKEKLEERRRRYINIAEKHRKILLKVTDECLEKEISPVERVRCILKGFLEERHKN